MASINSDIRLRSRGTGRKAVLVATVALATLSLSFGLSLLPAVVLANNI